MITLEISPETWDKAVGRMVLGHTRHNAVSETALRDALKVLGIEVAVSEVPDVAPVCGNCKHWTPTVGDFMGDCGRARSDQFDTPSDFSCLSHTPEGSE